MCLSILIRNPKGLIEEGTLSSNFEYAITHNNSGHRCGYIKMLPGHPWHGADYDNDIGSSAMVHGGLTFSESDVPCDKAGADNGWWLGFDCAHGGDAFDWDLASKEHRQLTKFTILAGYTYNQGIVRTTEYVRDQLEYLGLQAAAAAHSQGKPENSDLTPCLA